MIPVASLIWLNQLYKAMETNVKKTSAILECPICHASAVESCKSPEKKASKDCPRVK